MAKKKEAKRELTNIRPDKVSLVDRAANGQQFFVVKSAEDSSDKKELYRNILQDVVTNYKNMIDSLSSVDKEDGTCTINKSFVDNTLVYKETLSKLNDDVIVNKQFSFEESNHDKIVAATSMAVSNIEKQLQRLDSDDDISEVIQKSMQILDTLNGVYCDMDVDKPNHTSNEQNNLSQYTEKNTEQVVAQQSLDDLVLFDGGDIEEVSKALESASDRLNSVRAMLAVPEDYSHERAMKEVKKALAMLVSRAKLETILKASVEAIDGEEMCEKKVDEQTEEAKVEKEETPVESKEEPKAEAVEEETTEEETVQKEEESVPEPSVDSKLLSLLESMGSKLDALTTQNKAMEDRIEKMENFRAPSNGTSKEEKVEKSDSHPFDGFGPFSVIGG